MTPRIKINNRTISSQSPVYVVAEMSANHHQSIEKALEIIRAAKDCGADAVKIQTYTPDTITIDCDRDDFQIKETLWKGKTLYRLYQEAHTPWEWQPELQKEAQGLGLDFFSSPFDQSAVDFLEKLEVPAYKIASFELVDIPLLKRVAQTGKPVILSTGMASLAEIHEAVAALKDHGCREMALLKCTSAYPADARDANLSVIPFLAQTFNRPSGLSDHSRGSALAVAAVALGACIIEKHLCLDKGEKGPDTPFSMKPKEFKKMVEDIRRARKGIGRVCFDLSKKEEKSLVFRRSLYAVEDIRAGEKFSHLNIRSIRPGHGLAPKYLDILVGKTAEKDIPRGTPLSWDLIA